MEEVAKETIERNDENILRFSPDIIEETIKANLEPLHAQIFALTEYMDRLIQGNSARDFTTAGTRELRQQSESPFAEAPGTCSFAPVAPLTTAGYSPDTLVCGKFFICFVSITRLEFSPVLRRLASISDHE